MIVTGTGVSPWGHKALFLGGDGQAAGEAGCQSVRDDRVARVVVGGWGRGGGTSTGGYGGRGRAVGQR